MDPIAADIFMNKRLAGRLEKSAGRYKFTYLAEYLKSGSACPISYSFPLREEPFESDQLFAFFQGLVSEGWLLKMQSQNQKIDERDLFKLLLENGEDLIGAISVRPRKKT